VTDAKPDDVLQGLLDGNRRFIEGRMEHAHESPTDRDALLEEQHPCVTLLGCSDSRVPPSVIFDVGLGQVFSIRIAGHVLSDEVRASVRYAAVHLGTPLILVLGHEGCGAVTETLQAVRTGGDLSQPLVRDLAVPVRRALSDEGDEDVVNRAVLLHTRAEAAALREDAVLKPLIDEGRLRVAAAVYRMHTGEVELLSQ